MKKIIFTIFTYISFMSASDQFLPLTGIIKPIYEGKIGVSTEGKVEKIIFKEGQKVKKGEVILSLDSHLQMLESQRRKLLLDDKTQLESLKENTEILKEILQKKEKLYEATKSISFNELQQVKMQYTKTKAELEVLQVNEKKEFMEYGISQQLLDYYDLKSPIDGVITKIEPKVGEWVQVGKEIVQIVNSEICFVEVDLSVNDLQTLSVGSKVIVEVMDGKGVSQKEGTVVFISAIADSSSGLIRAKINFSNQDNKAIPGLTARVILK